MRERGVAVLQRDERDVLAIGAEQAAAGRRHPVRRAAEQVVEDGELVGRQIFDDVDVVPDGSEVGARRVDVLDGAEIAAGEPLVQVADAGVVDEDVTVHQHAAGAGRGGDERPRVGERRAHRLFEQHVLAGFERQRGELHVRACRRGNHDRVDVAAPDEVVR